MSKETNAEQVMQKLLEAYNEKPSGSIKAERQGAKILFTSSREPQAQGSQV